MFNGGVRGKRAKDGVGFLSTAEQFNQKSFLVPTVTSFSVTDVSYVPLDNTAVDIAGGETIVINGSGFASGATVQVGATTIGSVTFIDQNRLAFTAPALSSGSYTIYVTNSSGGTGILVSGLVYSGLPTYSTTAGSLGTVYETANINTAVVATGDAPITYSLLSGTLPSGATLNSNGTITGNAPVDSSSTTYSFTIQASDGQLQDSTRSFSLTIDTDVLTWGLANNTSYTLDGNSVMSNVTLSATSTANSNSGVTFAANTLPTGVSLSGNTIFGTPTTEQTVYSALTATATQTGRTATRFVSWTVSLGDPFFKYVSLLLKGDGTNGAQNNTFLDGSTNNFSITRNGNTTQGTFSPYGANWSNYFDGAGDTVSAASDTSLIFGTGDFTVECWFNSGSQPGPYNTIIGGDTAGSLLLNIIGIGTSTGVYVNAYGSGSPVYNQSYTVTQGIWFHLAATRSGTSFRVFVNGTQLGATVTDSTNFSAATRFIGGAGNSNQNYSGYVSNARLVKGTAVYTSNFTPSTTPLTPIANTSLLTCQSNRFIDNSTNAFAITVSGNTNVQRYSPFSPTATYSTSTIGGSGYFDGTGDYLSLANNAAFTVGTGAVTIETWIYCTSLTQTYQGIIGGRLQDGNTGYPGLSLVIDDSKLFFTIMGITTGLTDTNNVPLNQWVHVVGVRSGTNAALFVNGVRKAFSASNSTNGSSSNMAIGRYYSADDGYYFSGYISNARLVKGTAVYDPTVATLTVPTAPVTAITNTSLLTNFTNAGIIDNTMLNNLETVGNAQISTTQSKFGGSSMYFDGTGDYLTQPSSQNFNFGTGNFTMEGWFYQTGLSSSYPGIVSNPLSWGNAGAWAVLPSHASGIRKLQFYCYNAHTSNPLLLGTTTLSDNTWYYFAVTRSDTTFRLFLDGTIEATATFGGDVNSVSSGLVVGINQTASGYTFQGYIDDLRITKGYARYTSNFAPPTSSFQTK